MNGINITECNQSAETCPVRARVAETVTFCDMVGAVDPAMGETGKTLRDFGDLCLRGTCPGQNLDTTRAILRELIDLRGTGDDQP